jgi:alkanesulfonate monooxygenase
MSASIFWTLAPRGDRGRGEWQGRGLKRAPGWQRDEREGRFGPYDHLFQVARAAEISGFEGAFIPWEPAGEDPWIVASSLAREVRGLVFLPEIQPAFATPVYLAKLSASFERLARNRLGWKIDVERDPAVRRAHGDFLEGAEWFQRADEYLVAAKGVWSTHPFDFRGRFYDVEAGGLDGPLSKLPPPPIYTSGGSADALELAAKHAAVHLVAPGPVGAVRVAIARLNEAASRHGRSVAPGLRLTVAARHTAEEAAVAAQRSGTVPDLVGDFGFVAARLEELAALGVERFILDASPQVEEAYRLGEHLFPRLSFRARAGRNVISRAV